MGQRGVRTWPEKTRLGQRCVRATGEEHFAGIDALKHIGSHLYAISTWRESIVGLRRARRVVHYQMGLARLVSVSPRDIA